MGIRFNCPNGHNLHVKSFLAGKRAICPKCGVKLEVPGGSGSPQAGSANSPPAVPAGAGQWFVRTPNGEQFGPADESMFQNWIVQGRVNGSCMVWKEGWDDWKSAEEVVGTSPPPVSEPQDSSVPKPPPAAPFAPPEDAGMIRPQDSDSRSGIRIDTDMAKPKRKKSRALLYVLVAACAVLMFPLIYILSRA